MKKLLCLLVMLATPAWGQVITPAPSGFQRLYSTGTSVGNGADTTEDVLQSFTLSAGQFANVGDTIRVVASGACAATADTKTIRIRLGGISGSIVANPQCTTASNTAWTLVISIMKTGSNTQSFGEMGGVVSSSNNSAAKSGTLTLTDTSTIQIVVTGQNSTTSSAGSITCQIMLVDYMH